jgi:hypothetical protein
MFETQDTIRSRKEASLSRALDRQTRQRLLEFEELCDTSYNKLGFLGWVRQGWGE